MSIQITASRSGRPEASRKTTVQLVPSRPMPRIRFGSTRLSSRALRIESTRAVSQSAGLCSAQPGWGCTVRLGLTPKPRHLPAGSNTPARKLSVPASMPSR